MNCLIISDSLDFLCRYLSVRKSSFLYRLIFRIYKNSNLITKLNRLKNNKIEDFDIEHSYIDCYYNKIIGLTIRYNNKLKTGNGFLLSKMNLKLDDILYLEIKSVNVFNKFRFDHNIFKNLKILIGPIIQRSEGFKFSESLISLTLRNVNFVNIQNHQNLRYLCLLECCVNFEKQLPKLENLIHLDYSKCQFIFNKDTFTTFKNLKRLFICGCSGITRINIKHKISKLRFIYQVYESHIYTLDGLIIDILEDDDVYEMEMDTFEYYDCFAEQIKCKKLTLIDFY